MAGVILKLVDLILIFISTLYTREHLNQINCIPLKFCLSSYIFRGGAVVAQAPVKRLVVGPNPTRGAKEDNEVRTFFQTKFVIVTTEFRHDPASTPPHCRVRQCASVPAAPLRPRPNRISYLICFARDFFFSEWAVGLGRVSP